MIVTDMPVESLVPYARNPRHNTAAIDAVKASIAEFGFRQPIVVDEKMVVIVGHTRLEAAKALGLKMVPVHVAEGLTAALAHQKGPALPHRTFRIVEPCCEIRHGPLEALPQFSPRRPAQSLAGQCGVVLALVRFVLQRKRCSKPPKEAPWTMRWPAERRHSRAAWLAGGA